MSSCEKKLNGYVNLKRTVGYQSTIICKFACYILACLSSCLITEWLQLPHEATSSCHRVSVYCTVSCFAGSVFTSMLSPYPLPDHTSWKGHGTAQEVTSYPFVNMHVYEREISQTVCISHDHDPCLMLP